MPIRKLSEAQIKKLKEHSKDHGGTKHYNAMKRLMEEPPYPSISKAHGMLVKKKPKFKVVKKKEEEKKKIKFKVMTKEKYEDKKRVIRAEKKGLVALARRRKKKMEEKKY